MAGKAIALRVAACILLLFCSFLSGSWGAVVRSEQGVLISAWGPINHCPNDERAEAIGMLNGLKSMLPTYAGPIHIESDSAILVKELKMEGNSKSAMAGTVQDIKNVMSLFQDVFVSKVNRSGNKLAYELAKLGHSVSSGRVMLGCVPPCAVETLMQACNSNSSVIN